MKILSAEQIRKWDEFTIVNEPISSIDLMERAARKCVEWLEDEKLTDKSIRIFCGKGNNGGDGLAMARLLFENGHVPEVYVFETASSGSEDFTTNLSRLQVLPVNIHFIEHADFFPSIQKADLVIDALFGSGLSRSLEGLAAALVQHINTTAATVVSIDLPSGMFADKPTFDKHVIKATVTLTSCQRWDYRCLL